MEFFDNWNHTTKSRSFILRGTPAHRTRSNLCQFCQKKRRTFILDLIPELRFVWKSSERKVLLFHSPLVKVRTSVEMFAWRLVTMKDIEAPITCNFYSTAIHAAAAVLVPQGKHTVCDSTNGLGIPENCSLLIELDGGIIELCDIRPKRQGIYFQCGDQPKFPCTMHYLLLALHKT